MSIYTPDDGRFSYTVKLNRLSVGKCTHKTPMDWIGSYHLLGVYIYIYRYSGRDASLGYMVNNSHLQQKTYIID